MSEHSDAMQTPSAASTTHTPFHTAETAASEVAPANPEQRQPQASTFLGYERPTRRQLELRHSFYGVMSTIIAGLLVLLAMIVDVIPIPQWAEPLVIGTAAFGVAAALIGSIAGLVEPFAKRFYPRLGLMLTAAAMLIFVSQKLL